MLEFWSAGAANGGIDAGLPGDQIPNRFRRVSTDLDGCFALKIASPVSTRLGDGREQAPHFLVLVFARGLQRQLISRVYLEGERGNEGDPVLHSVSEERRKTLIAARSGTQLYCWDVILQGINETVFFAW
jgi:protocatechuate 3,4-dioxygenase alpha subunit